MAEGYGSILTGAQAAQQIAKFDRDKQNRLTWQNLLQSNDLAAGKAVQDLESSYASASMDAYTSYLANKAAIENSNVVGSGKQGLLNSNNEALQQAYDSYRQSLSSNLTQVEEARAQTQKSIEDALAEQGQNIADYTNLHYDYLAKLYDDWVDAGSVDSGIFSDKRFSSKYLYKASGDDLKVDQYGVPLDENLQPMLDANGDAVLDENGNPIYYRLKTREELATELYNPDGSLTVAGVDFFDQLENQAAAELGSEYSWGNFLQETNPDLYDWATSYNPYNYTLAGTNAGSFNTMVGRVSTDNLYSFAERMGGLSEEQITSLYSDITDKAAELKEKLQDIDAYGTKGYIKDVKAAVEDIAKLTDSIGLTSALEESGISLDELSAAIASNLDSAKSGGQLAEDVISELFKGSAAGAAGGGAVGAVVPVVGTGIGAAVGAFTGFIMSLFKANEVGNANNEANLELARQTEEAYANFVNSMVNWSLQKRKQAEIDFNSGYIR